MYHAGWGSTILNTHVLKVVHARTVQRVLHTAKDTVKEFVHENNTLHTAQQPTRNMKHNTDTEKKNYPRNNDRDKHHHRTKQQSIILNAEHTFMLMNLPCKYIDSIHGTRSSNKKTH